MVLGHTYHSILYWHPFIKESGERSLKNSLGERVELEDKPHDYRE